MTEFNNEDEAEEVEHESGPIGVHIDSCVIVDTDDEYIAHGVASRVVDELNSKAWELEYTLCDVDFIVNIDRTSDYFYPETEE